MQYQAEPAPTAANAQLSSDAGAGPSVQAFVSDLDEGNDLIGQGFC